MVSGETIDHIQVGPQAVCVFPGCQTRTHFAATGMSTRDVRNIIFAQEQVMRADLAGHFETLLFGSFDEQHLFFE